MIDFGLPTTVEVGGETYNIRSDYRDILNIIEALNDNELSDTEKAFITLASFYPDYEKIPVEAQQEAVNKCFDFINCGRKEPPREKTPPKLVDWAHDFQYIVAPINRVAGAEVRSVQCLHWWTFISYYYEIGPDCLFAQISHIRSMKAHHQKLDKSDEQWYRENRDLVDFEQETSEEEDRLLEMWGAKRKEDK